MGGVKRPRDTGDVESTEADGHAQQHLRKRQYTDADAQLAKLYNDLADEVEAVRSKAAQDLIRNLWKKSPDRSERLDTAVRRLVKGLCSGRKAARLGFSVPLPEILRLRYSSGAEEDGGSHFDLSALVKNVIIWTRAEGGAKGPERREHMHGRRFAYQAILQSDVGSHKKVSDSQWQYFLDCIFDLAKEKQWARRDCGAMLYNYLVSPGGARLSDARVRCILDVMIESKQVKTAEAVGLWIAIADHFPNVSFPKHVWHHNDPLSSKERQALGKVMLDNAQDDDPDVKKGGYRQSTPSFSWNVLLNGLYTRKGGKDFSKFWNDVVAGSMFSQSSSAERKSLGLQVLSIAISTAPVELLQHVLHPTILRCLVDQRSNKDRYLFEATKSPLNTMAERAKREPATASVLVRALLDQNAANLDQVIKLKAVETIVDNAEGAALLDIASTARRLILDSDATEVAHAEMRRRVLADVLLSMVRARKGEALKIEPRGRKTQPSDIWPETVFCVLADVAYLQVTAEPSISTATRAVFQARLTSCLNVALDSGLDQGVQASVLVAQYLHSQSTDHFVLTLKDSTRKTLRRANKTLDKAIKSGDNAFSLLIALSSLQVYNEEADAVGVLDDAVTCYESKGKTADSSAVLIELLLSFVSKPSALFRKLAEQVFSACAADVTAESLQSLLDILAQQESLSGQQELFDQNTGDTAMEVDEEDDEEDEDGEDEDGEDDEEDDDDVDEDDDQGKGDPDATEYLDVEDDSDLELANGLVVDPGDQEDGDATEYFDVEDASDVELANGVVVSKSDLEDSDEDDSEDEDDSDSAAVPDDDDSDSDVADDDGGEDEEEAFDRKLAEALRTSGAAAANDSDDDGSDMDDEQMLALEPHLNAIFAERARAAAATGSTGTGQRAKDRRDARDTVVQFKNRVLDLLAVYARAQHASPLALNLLLPLAALVRATSSRPTAERALAVLRSYVDACARHKALPRLESAEEGFELLAALHAEMRRGGPAKLHAGACSRASLFVAKVLCAMDPAHYDRVADMYVALLKGWRREPKSHVQQSVFTEWMSWSIETRRRE